MKIRKLLTFGILAVCFAGRAAGANASSFRAHVPFKFVVGNQTLPPGTYIVQRLMGRILESTGVVVIKTSDHRFYRAVITLRKVDHPTNELGVSKLRFTTIKGQHYLSQIYVAADGLADQLSTPADGTSQQALPVREIRLVSLH